MRVIDEAGVVRALPWRALIDALAETFKEGCEQPLRTVHTVQVPDEPDANLLMMPAWRCGDRLAVKLAFIAPGNGRRDMPVVSASIVVFDARTGVAEAMIDGGEVTARRTAAASALAADHLARGDAETLLIVGAGRIASNLIPAHCAVRPYRRVLVWARNAEKARAFAVRDHGVAAEVVAAADLDAAVADADVVSCATLSTEPLVAGAKLKPGAHVDLVGGYLWNMREADDTAVKRAAGSIYVDTYDGVLSEAGDILQPLENGTIDRSDIAGDLAALCRGEAAGRTADDQVTLFKSVGAAIEDFAAARLAAAAS